MAKKKKEVIEENGIILDSKEELQIKWWLDDLVKAGYIEKYVKVTESIVLSEPFRYNCLKASPTKKEPDRMKEVERVLLNGHVYTPDFKVYWTDAAIGVFITIGAPISDSEQNLLIADYENLGEHKVSYIEVKGDGMDINNMVRLFVINQKWMLKEYGIYVNLLKPQETFKRFFTPQRYYFTEKTGRARKINFKVVTLQEYLNK